MLCRDCPRNCGAERSEYRGAGFCGAGYNPVVSKTMLHMWEEPCLSGTRGAGAVFFAGCNLRCVYCQNRDISRTAEGKAITPEELRGIYFELIEKGAVNIDLVTPTHFTRAIKQSLSGGLPVPAVYNCGGYESVPMLRLLEGSIDIYMPDFKYSSSELALRLSRAPDYPEIAARAIREMFRQVGPPVFGPDGLLKRGVIIRHLVLPGEIKNTLGVIDRVAEMFEDGQVLFSLMGQYTPMKGMTGELSRTLRSLEYKAAIKHLEGRGISLGYIQELSAAGEEFIPDFES